MITVSHLFGGYGKTPIIKDLSFSLNRGALLFVVGPNGSGKTTLFKLMLNLLEKTKGSIKIDGVDTDRFKTEALAKKVAYIPQQHEPAFDYTVKEMVMMGRTSHIGMFASPSTDDEAVVDAVLDMLHLTNFRERAYDQLSGGEMQMVLIARAVCQQANTIIMDEPMMNLDYKNQAMVIGAIERLQAQGYTVIMSTHNMVHIGFKKAYVLLLKNGESYGFGEADGLLNKQKLRQVYDIDMDVIHMEDSSGNNRYVCIPLG